MAPAIPHLYARMVAGGEQAVSTGPRFAVGPTRNHVELCDASRLNPGSNSDNWAWRTSGARGITPTSSAFTQAHGVARLRRAFICGKSSHFGDVLVYLLSSPAPSFRGPYRAKRVAGCPTWRRVSPAIHHFEHEHPISSDHATRAIRVGMRLSIFDDAPFSSCCAGPAVALPRSDIVNETLKTPRNCA